MKSQWKILVDKPARVVYDDGKCECFPIVGHIVLLQLGPTSCRGIGTPERAKRWFHTKLKGERGADVHGMPWGSSLDGLCICGAPRMMVRGYGSSHGAQHAAQPQEG